MKLRLRSFESKETLKIEVPDPSSLQQLKSTISTILSSSPSSSLHLSLNRKDEINPPSPTDSLHSLGIATGDLIFYTFNPSAFSSHTLPHKPTAENPPTLPAEPQTLEMADDETAVKNNPEPDFVKRILRESLGDDVTDFKLLVFAVHAVIIESGFVRVDRDSGKAIGDVSSSSMLSLRYTLPEIVSKGLSHAVDLKIQTLGNFVNVYGSLVDDVGARVHRVYLDKFRFSKPLEMMLANSEPSGSNASVGVGVSVDGNDGGDNEVFELWKIAKDKLALPLLIDLCEKGGLDLPPCFMRLPMELKLLIFEYLSGDDLAKVCCTCSELSYLASNDELWRKKFEKEFGDRMNGTMKFFKNLFAHYWAEKKKSKQKPPFFPTPRSGIMRYFQRRRGPHPFGVPPIWGGEYDLQPNFGANLPLAYTPRRIFFPPCHLGEI